MGFSPQRMSQLIKEGHWSVYITFLKSSRMLYYSRDYRVLFDKIGKIDFIKNLKNFDRIKWKAKFDRGCIKKGRSYDGAKYALPALKNRLQLLTYINSRKLILNLDKLIKLNKDILTLREGRFLIRLDKFVKGRKDVLYDKKIAIKILDKINREILSLLDKRRLN